jgi:hypothetical protein
MLVAWNQWLVTRAPRKPWGCQIATRHPWGPGTRRQCADHGQRASQGSVGAREVHVFGCGCRGHVGSSWELFGVAGLTSLRYDVGLASGALGRRFAVFLEVSHGGALRSIGVTDGTGDGGQRPMGGAQPTPQPGTGLRPFAGGTSGATGGARCGAGRCGGVSGCAAGGDGEAACGGPRIGEGAACGN